MTVSEGETLGGKKVKEEWREAVRGEVGGI